MPVWNWILGLLYIAGAVLSYELGTEYKYSYETTVLLSECYESENSSQSVGHRLRAHVSLTSVWEKSQQQLIKIQISNAQLQVPKKSVFTDHPFELTKAKEPSFVLLENGIVKKIWDDPNEHYSSRNFKRGIASFLQVRQSDGLFQEADVSGICDVMYEKKKGGLRKTKSNCRATRFDSSMSQLPGIRSASSLHDSVWLYDFLDDKTSVLASCNVKDTINMKSNTWSRTSLCINSNSELIFESLKKTEDIFKNEEFQKETSISTLVENDLEGIFVPQQEKSPKSLIDSILKSKDSLKSSKLASLKSTTTFYKLLSIMRTSSRKDILDVLSNKKLNDLKPQIMDLVAATLTKDSVKAGFEHFQKMKDYDEMLERFLISLSVAPRQFPYIFEEMKSFAESMVRNEKIQATLLTTYGTLLKQYANEDSIKNTNVVNEYLAFLEHNLQKCSLESCKLAHLRAIGNAALPQSLPLLLKHISEGGKVALEAAVAIQNIPPQQVPSEIEKHLITVFSQIGQKQDRSVRIIAAGILLRRSECQGVLRVLLRALQDQSDPEFSTQLASKILHMANEDPKLKERLLKLLPEKDIGHYYSLSQKGSSAVLSKDLITSANLNVSYSLEMEMLVGGLMKRSIFDVDFKSQLGTSNFLTVGLFAEGLASLAGGGEDDEEGVSPTAGIELTLMGSHLRPYILFSSTSELMGHAWSGTASEPTPVLQGIYAFSDDERLHILSNGMPVRIQLRGVLSVDCSGSIQVSLWSRNAASLVKNAGALFMRGSATIDAGVSRVQGAIQFSGQSSIDFKTDTLFANSPFKICMKMEHPPIAIKYDVHRSVVVEGSSKFHLKKSKKRKMLVGGKSFPLHKRNSDMCSLMDSEKN